MNVSTSAALLAIGSVAVVEENVAMRRLMLAFALALSLLAPAIQSQATACAFQLGFATVHDLAPTQVGDCVEDEGHNPENGDGLQHTTNGLMVWRKTDNWTAFTNGYRTWINGPNSLRYRLNEERFSWESDAANHATVADWEVVTLTRPGWGFSVRYPSSWRRDDSAPTISILYSHPPHEYRFGRAPGESQIDVGIFSRYGSKVGILSAEDKVRGYPVGMPPRSLSERTEKR